jgi:1-acyl-sn-glycerol-3-phosphate acyltransferase
MWMRIQIFLLNLSFYTLLICIMLFEVPLLIVAGLIVAPFFSWRKNLRNVRELIKMYGRSVLWAGWPWVRVCAEYPAGKPPKAAIYVCNHRATSDGFLISMFSCEGIQVVNIWPFKIPVLGVFAKLAGYLSVRELSPEEFLRRAKTLLDEGVSVIGFPEGTRAGSRIMGPFHGSLFRLALKTGAPIVPVCISGSERIPQKGSVVLHPGKICLRFLEPITKETFASMSSFKLKKYVREKMATELDRMENKE